MVVNQDCRHTCSAESNRAAIKYSGQSLILNSFKTLCYLIWQISKILGDELEVQEGSFDGETRGIKSCATVLS
jgi:hypothetical protein